MPIPSEIQDLIIKSGNSFHARVARWLQSNDWQIVVSPYYLDQNQGKARELDLIAERIWPVKDSFGRTVEFIGVRLFIECKYINLDTVFWFADKDRNAAEGSVCALPLFGKEWSSTRKHHYLSAAPRVAKLFASGKPVNQKNIENEPFFKAINQSLNGLIAFRGQRLLAASLQNHQDRLRTILEYPVVVFNSFEKVFGADFDQDTEPHVIEDNFQFEVRFAYTDRSGRQRNEYFLLDVAAFDKLSVLCSAIEGDVKGAAKVAVFMQ